MRSFGDASGGWWDVAVDRESWGTYVLIFAQRGGSEIRRSMLTSSTAPEAQLELEALSEEELRRRLAAADPFPGSG
jgi:hypothetical protein